MASKMVCQLLVALCVISYASAAASGKAVRLLFHPFHGILYHACIIWCPCSSSSPCGPFIGEKAARDHIVSKALSCLFFIQMAVTLLATIDLL